MINRSLRPVCERGNWAPGQPPFSRVLMHTRNLLLRHRNIRSLYWSKNSPRIASKMPYRPPLRFEDGPLVWIDCEMTGLDPKKHKIIGVFMFNFQKCIRINRFRNCCCHYKWRPRTSVSLIVFVRQFFWPVNIPNGTVTKGSIL